LSRIFIPYAFHALINYTTFHFGKCWASDFFWRYISFLDNNRKYLASISEVVNS
jgi:ABC-type glycerol-3-phosphate transport system permease component